MVGPPHPPIPPLSYSTSMPGESSTEETKRTVEKLDDGLTEFRSKLDRIKREFPAYESRASVNEDLTADNDTKEIRAGWYATQWLAYATLCKEVREHLIEVGVLKLEIKSTELKEAVDRSKVFWREIFARKNAAWQRLDEVDGWKEIANAQVSQLKGSAPDSEPGVRIALWSSVLGYQKERENRSGETSQSL